MSNDPRMLAPSEVRIQRPTSGASRRLLRSTPSFLTIGARVTRRRRLAGLAGARVTRRRRLAGLAGVLVAGGFVLTGSASAAAPVDLLPDLRMVLPDRFVVCGAPTGGTFQTENCPDASPDDRWLRFDTMLLNAGRGTFRVVASRTSVDEDHMHAEQRIRRSDGTWLRLPTSATLGWAQEEDGHPHWHTQGIERYRLLGLPGLIDGAPRLAVKRGFCFFDGVPLRLDLKHARATPQYTFESCGEPGQSRDALWLRVGLSVGWADEYPWNYAGQRIDLGSVPDGEYLLCLTADPLEQFRELREGNNESWARIELATAETGDGYGVQVTVLARGTTACQSQVPYPIPAVPARGGHPQGSRR
jgi:hypothetical protein